MSILGTSSLGNAYSLGTSGNSGSAKSAKDTSSGGFMSELDQLEAYFKESPAQRVIDNWLAAHHISKEEYNAMSPEKQEALKKQMAKDIEDEVKRKNQERMLQVGAAIGF